MLDLAVLAALLAVQADPRLPVPEAASQKESEKLIREVFKEEYARKAPADRAALARKLLQQALETRDDPTACFVLLAQAEDLAVQGGEPDLALTAVDETGRRYAVDRAARREAVLQRVTGSAKTMDDFLRLMAGWSRVAGDALLSGDFDRAEKASTTAATMARRTKDIPSVSRAEAAGREVADLKSKFRGLAQARETLQTRDDDPTANVLVGRFDCFVRGDWSAGLPRLARGADAVLKKLAEGEGNASAEPADRAAVADGWYALSERETGRSRLSLRRRAAEGYRKAASGLTGLSRTKAEKRTDEILRSLGSGSDVDLLKLIDVVKDSPGSTWVLDAAGLTSKGITDLNIPYVPPEEYDLRLILEPKDNQGGLIVGLVAAGRQTTIAVDEDKLYSGLSRIDGLRAQENETKHSGILLTKDRESALHCEVRKTGITFTIDGKLIFDWKGDLQRLSRNPALKISRPDTLFLCANDRILIKQLMVIPITGEGRKTR